VSGVTETFYPTRYGYGDTLGEHLEFALKYDGTNLGILAALFQAVAPCELEHYIATKPQGKNVRRLWFLYELLTGTKLDIDDLRTGNYVDLLDPNEYYTVSPAKQIRRQRINDNLLGDHRFCPTVRRTEELKRFETVNFPERCRAIVANYSPQLLKRAVAYLYTKETRSSFEIERITPNSTRTERFVSLLHSARSEDYCNKSRLLELQHHIVDPRFQDADYRSTQNYVGESAFSQREKVHYVSPKPDDLSELMEGLINSHGRMSQSNIHASVHDTVVSYGFVFLHPFEDGNGRIHRFLIHNILARRGFTPSDMIFPVSASMLRNLGDYDLSLEAFSRPLLEHVEYQLDDEGQMTVQNDTVNLYKYVDLTVQAESLFRFIEQTIETEWVDELSFLANYDKTKKAIQNITDIPDRKIDLFINVCVQNNGRLSKAKRESQFDFLSDHEIVLMEGAIQSVYFPSYD
jgi:Fic family protein